MEIISGAVACKAIGGGNVVGMVERRMIGSWKPVVGSSDIEVSRCAQTACLLP